MAATLTNGQRTLFVLTPIPEPSTYALMLAGMGTLAWIARRQRGRSMGNRVEQSIRPDWRPDSGPGSRRWQRRPGRHPGWPQAKVLHAPHGVAPIDRENRCTCGQICDAAKVQVAA